jgi:hypothetical protein
MSTKADNQCLLCCLLYPAQTRKADALSHLDVVWDVSDVPDVHTELKTHKMMRWMGIPHREAVKALRMDDLEVFRFLFQT